MQTEPEPRKRQPQGQLKIGSSNLEVDRRSFEVVLEFMVMSDSPNDWDDDPADPWLTEKLKTWNAYWSAPSTGGKVLILDELAQQPGGIRRLIHLLQIIESITEGREGTPGLITPHQPLEFPRNVREWVAAVLGSAGMDPPVERNPIA